MRKASGSRSKGQQSEIPQVTFEYDYDEKKKKENSVSVKAIEIVRKTKEDKFAKDLKLEDFDLKTKGYVENQTCPLYRRYDSRNFMTVAFDSKCPKQVTTQILSKGVDVRYAKKPGFTERYTFFAHSASQLRSRMCVLYNNNVGKAEDIISEFGEFHEIKTLAKRAARIGLLLSTAGETLKLLEEDIFRIGDVERNGYTFTDGCGYISPVLAKKITEHLRISEKYKHQKHPYPSVFQVRLLGCKGVLALKPSLVKGLEIRKSMEKFKWLLPPPFPLGVVDKGYSRPYEVGSLNKQFILLLAALGIEDDVFLKKQKMYFHEIMSLTSNKRNAFTYLCAFGETEIAERLLKSDNIGDVLLKVKSIQQRAYGSYNDSISELEKSKKSPALRLKIPIEKSRNVYGISDPSENALKYGTCFFQPTIRGEAKPIVGKIVVLKNPCYNPGDVRVLDCVDVPCCHHLVDCIVFPTDGERPHPDEIAGSDLDGDKFFVCWDPDLVPSEIPDPVSYPAAKVVPTKNIRQDDMIAYFARYSNSTIGKIDCLFSKWADRKGVGSIECLELSALFSRAVDSAKTGERVCIPRHLEIASEDNLLHENFVWHKMMAEAILFVENRVKNPIMSNEVQLTEETLRSILANELITVSDYQLFRFLCRWAEHEKDVSEEQVSMIAKQCIDFTTFSLLQLRRVQIDCPGLGRDILLNPFARSKILSEVDCTDLLPNTADHYIRYSLIFRACSEDLSWDILNNILTSGLATILVLKFIIGDVEWVCVLDIPQKLETRETLEVNEAEHSLPRAFLFIHQDQPVSERFSLDSTYSFFLHDQRLQIYQGTKTRTFISFSVNDANDLSVVSIDLQRFDKRLSNRLGGIRVRKEAFVDLEVYCHDPNDQPISKIHFAEPPNTVVPTENEKFLVDQFQSEDKDFPDMGEEYGGIYLEAEKEIQKLRDSVSLTTDDFNFVRKLLEKMEDPLERHEWACKLETLLDGLSDVAYGGSEEYKTLLLYLLDGLKKCSSRVLSGSKVNITLHRRVERLLKRMRDNDAFLSVKSIFEVFSTLLFVHDYQTSMFVVGLLGQGTFPISKEEFVNHENSHQYFIHWFSLLYTEILEEVKEREDLEMIPKGQSAVCEGKVSAETNDLGSGNKKNKDPLFTIFVLKGEMSCLIGDYLAFSPSNASSVFRERKCIMEVKSCAGKHLYADPVWPDSNDILNELSRTASWKITSFPNLVSFNRMLEALKKLCCDTHLESSATFAVLLNTWTEAKNEFEDDRQTKQKNANENSEASWSEENPKESVLEGDDAEKIGPLGNTARKSSCDLNPSQEKAVRQACNNPLTLIQGPPGTGKSKTSANIVKKLLAQYTGEKILAVAETNEGVDNLMDKIIQLSNGIPESQVLRVGSSTWSVREHLRKFTLEARYAERMGGKQIRENWMDKKIANRILSEAKVVCTTCISAGSKIFEETIFRKLLVDEASQATEPAILVPISRGSNVLVLVGDDKQLPPTIKSKAAKQLSKTTFSRLRESGHPVYLLDTQYRMHPCMSEFPSAMFYNKQLRNGVTSQERKTPAGFPWPCVTRPLAFVTTPKDTREQGGISKKNVREAEVVKCVVDNVLQAGELQEKQIGIVTPYSAQVKLLTEEIQKRHPNISIRSVDGFQGQERELIIFSAVRSNDFGHLGFLNDDQRMNVLLTRARSGLIVVGNKKTLDLSDSSWKKWVEWMETEKLIVESESLFPSSCDGFGGPSERGRGERIWKGNRRPPDNNDLRVSRGRRGKRRGSQRF